MIFLPYYTQLRNDFPTIVKHTVFPTIVKHYTQLCNDFPKLETPFYPHLTLATKHTHADLQATTAKL